MLTLTFLALVLYGVILAFLWGWAILHALTTPRVDSSRKYLWTMALILNPIASMWYWYIWRRWAFWTLFIPVLLFSTFLPFVLERIIQALMIRELADRFVSIMTVILENIIEIIPLPILIPLIVFPVILRLAALAHLGGNTNLEAADRNDHAVTFALPLFGYGAAMTYCLRWRKIWAFVGFLWLLLGTSVFCWFLLNKITY